MEAVGQGSEKLVHHRCGFPFVTRVIAQMYGAVVVQYRDGHLGVSSLPLYHCPGCGGVLRLWWVVEGGSEVVLGRDVELVSLCDGRVLLPGGSEQVTDV